MAEFTPKDVESAPEEAKDVLKQVQGSYGFVPNVLGNMAHSPAAVKAYTTLNQLFENTAFSAIERNVVLLAASYENGCEYCMAAHSAGAKMAGVEDTLLERLRHGEALDDERLEGLRRFTALVVAQRGWVANEEVDAFLGVGYEKAQVFDVIMAVAMKTLSNYTNHIAHSPLDEAFESLRWEAPSQTK